MTQIKKENIKSLLSLANIITLIGFIIYQAQWQKGVDERLKMLESHDMPFKEQIEIFVPRVEMDGRFKNIETSLSTIIENQNIIRNNTK